MRPILRMICRSAKTSLLAGLLTVTMAVLMQPPRAGAAPVNTGTLAQQALRFEEPLVPTGPTDAADDAALSAAIAAYQARSAVDDFSALQAFAADHPGSPWRLAVLTNLGLADYHAGYFARAIDAFEQAWAAGRDATELHARALADRAGGELLKMHARLGHAARLTALLTEMSDRGLSGPATELRDGAKEGLYMMRHDPGVAYLCGPMALKNLLLAGGAPASRVAFLDAVRSGPNGVSLAEVGQLAGQAKLPYNLIWRAPGAAVPVPSVIHWKVNHFAAVVGRRDGRFQLIDPTFGRSLWVTQAAIDAEGSGYFLVPGGTDTKSATPWRNVGTQEAASVRGMGYTDSNDPADLTPDDPNAQNGGPNCGMCGYAFKEMLVSLQLNDTPVGYAPPKGPAVRTTITYDQREAGQPANFSFFNVSPKWTLNWLSYIQDDPTMPGSNVTRIVGGGGEVAYTGYSTTTQSFAPEVDVGALLTLTAANPATYRRVMPDGSTQVFAASNGATAYPRLVFLSKMVDPYGNALTFSYDSQFRLTTLVDATGRATKFAYTNASFPLQVTKITDPFGRAATLTYDGNGRLSQITDVLGLTSQFTYDSSSLVDALTTPYGTTQFVYGDNGNSRYLQATDPLGYTERLEYIQGAPNVPGSDPGNTVPQGIIAPFNQYLNERDTFYWDKHAYAVAAGNYLQARNRHWAHLASNTDVTSNTLESVKYPLENRIWYNYPGQPITGLGAGESGTLNLPSGIGRVLDNGATQLTQIAYNANSNPTALIDPVGRETMMTYAPNLTDVTSVQQNTASGAVTVAKFTYNAVHLPLTYTDAANRTTKYTYNAAGQLTALTNALGQKTGYQYSPLGYLMVTTNANGKTQASYTYDKYGRIATRTDSEGWAVSYTYDAMDRVTQEHYPDGTTTIYTYTKLDLTSVKDRQGRVTSFGYDADRRLHSVTDPLGHTTLFGRYENGALATLTDPNGNVTSFAIDVESRVNGKQYPDGSVTGYGYEASTGRLLFVSDALNQIKQFSYTTDDKLAGIQYLNSVNPTPNVSFAYDPYFPRTVSMTDGSGTTQYAYKAPGTLGALLLASEQPPYANSTIAYTYDALGRRVGRSIAGNAETIAYDALGRVATHVDDLGTFTLGYLGQTTQMTSQSNGTVGTTWTYDSNANDRRLTGIANTPSASSYGFTTTADDDITSIVDAFDHQTWTNSYDAADRLLGASSSAGPSYAYGYDAAGNIGSIQRPSGTTTVTPNALNQVATAGGAAFTYDANGNLLRDYARTYQWDADNRLIGIGYLSNPGLRTTFRYDGLGRRIAIGTVSGGVASETRYNWCDETLCQARTGADAVLRHYFAEGEETPSENMQLYYSVDQLGSVRDALAAGSGTSVAHYDYEPYGAPTGVQGATATDFRYAGLFDHQQSGLFLATYRAYDPVVGRWLSRDPMGEPGGINLYGYVQQSPLIYSDRKGKFLNLVTGAIGAAIGAVVGGGGDALWQLAHNGWQPGCINWGDVGAWAGGGAAVGGLAGLTFGGSLAAEAAAAAEAADVGAEASEGLDLATSDSWGNPDTLADHFARHGGDFGSASEDEYASQASQFFQNSQAEGLPTQVDANGTIRVYDPSTNTFGSFNADGTTKTFFQPTSPNYWSNQPGAPPTIIGGP